MKHKQKHEVSSLNIQTGEADGFRSNAQKGGRPKARGQHSMAKVEICVKDDLGQRELDITEMIDNSQVVRQRKVTDLPRHALAAPSVHKKNYDMMQQMKMRPETVLGATKFSNFNMLYLDLIFRYSASWEKL